MNGTFLLSKANSLYGSSEIRNISWLYSFSFSSRMLAISFIVFSEYITPVGLFGVFIRTALVWGVHLDLVGK